MAKFVQPLSYRTQATAPKAPPSTGLVSQLTTEVIYLRPVTGVFALLPYYCNFQLTRATNLWFQQSDLDLCKTASLLVVVFRAEWLHRLGLQCTHVHVHMYNVHVHVHVLQTVQCMLLKVWSSLPYGFAQSKDSLCGLCVTKRFFDNMPKFINPRKHAEYGKSALGNWTSSNKWKETIMKCQKET